MNLFLYGESKQEKQKQGKASKNQGSWTKGHPKNTQRDSVATSWAANVNTKGTNICSGPILTSLWAALGAKGLPKAPQKRHRGHPKDLQDTSLHQVATRATTDARKARKIAPQRLPNQVFFRACGARCLIRSMLFWKTANMQSAHACAVQTALQAPPTHPIMSLKHTLWNTKTRTVSHSDFNNFFTSKVDPRTCKPGLHWNGKHTNKC